MKSIRTAWVRQPHEQAADVSDVILSLTDDERDQRDKMIFECQQSLLAFEQAIGELLVLRKLRSAVKASRRQTPKVQQLLNRFPTKSIHIAIALEPQRFEELQPLDPKRKLWYVDS
jgi:hypothetical protein